METVAVCILSLLGLWLAIELLSFWFVDRDYGEADGVGDRDA